jgi:hypothetical protein
VIGPSRRKRVHRVGGEADRGHDQQEDHQLRLPAQDPDARAQVAGAALGQLLSLRADEEQRADEDQVRDSVEPERGRDAEVLDGERGAGRPDRAGEIEGQRVQRHGRRHLGLLDELRDQRLLRGRRERAHHAKRDRVGDHDPGRRQVEVGEQPEPGREHDRD